MDIYDAALPTPGMAALFRKSADLEERFGCCRACQQGDHDVCSDVAECRCVGCYPVDGYPR